MKNRSVFFPAVFAVFASGLSLAAEPFTEADFTWDPLTSFHKAVVVAGVNQMHEENPACKTIDPKSLQYDADHGNPDNPAFKVKCGEGDHVVTVSFTAIDIKMKK